MAMKKNASFTSSCQHRLVWALGAALLLAGVPVQAQWLVQDNNLYNLIKNEVVDDQLKNINKKLDTSGNGKGSFKNTEKDVSQSDKNFNALKLTTEELLTKKKEGQYADDAKEFFTETTPNCSEKSNDLIRNQCLRLRNIMGTQLKEIRNISRNLEARNAALKSIMETKFNTLGELQKKQYEISVLQTVIANDQMRLQTALASYQTMRDLYRTQYDEALQERNNDKKDGNGNKVSSARKLAAVGAAAATFVTTKKLVDNNYKAEIFKSQETVEEVIRRRGR